MKSPLSHNSRVAVFVGTRPEIIKTCTVTLALRRQRKIDSLFVHTGQHYHWDISKRFLSELSLPRPDFFLNVRSGPQGLQTARIIERTEKVMMRSNPAMVLVEGDTNSALGVSLAAAKLGIPLGHIEAGCRSFDVTMPEEINRKMISDCSSLNFAPTRDCVKNLRREGVRDETIYLTGHPIVDLFQEMKPSAERSAVLRKLGFEQAEYVLLTIHRQENTEDAKRLERILRGISALPIQVIFPIHPRTQQRIWKYGLSHLLKDVHVVTPLGYADTLHLIDKAAAVLTDSGGIQQEAYLSRTPCITLRENTEWVETVQLGKNFLVGSNISKLSKAFKIARALKPKWKNNRPRAIFGNDATRKIVGIIENYLGV